MKIAILGSRGIPANYGGYETFAEKISKLLVAKGHEVTVYCCRPYTHNKDRYYAGIKRIILPTFRIKELEKIFFNLLSLVHVSFTDNDMVLMLGLSATIFCFIPRIFRKKVFINVDGLEWKRKKWTKPISLYCEMSARLVKICCDKIITDSLVIQKHYLTEYGYPSVFIPYGAETGRCFSEEAIKKFSLRKNNYLLCVTRLEPENNVELSLRAFKKVKTDMALAVAGWAPYGNIYIELLKKIGGNDQRIKFLGPVYGKGYQELQSNAYFYIHGNEAGGTNPALLEAMGFGNCVLALDAPCNLEVIKNSAIAYSKNIDDLAGKMQYLVDNPSVVAEFQKKAIERISDNYSWDKVVNAYEKLFNYYIDKKRSGENYR